MKTLGQLSSPLFRQCQSVAQCDKHVPIQCYNAHVSEKQRTKKRKCTHSTVSELHSQWRWQTDGWRLRRVVILVILGTTGTRLRLDRGGGSRFGLLTGDIACNCNWINGLCRSGIRSSRSSRSSLSLCGWCIFSTTIFIIDIVVIGAVVVIGIIDPIWPIDDNRRRSRARF
jgi:hypothetical protein